MNEPVLTVAEMRAAEQGAMAGGTSAWELMQRAGQGAAQWVMRVAAGRPVTVLCGPGNNGGDGYVIADVLYRRGYTVHVIAPVEPKTATARTARQTFQGDVMTDGNLHGPVVVDALFGYGLTRQVEHEFASLLEKMVASHCYKIAIDVPSAVESDTGAILGPLPEYDLTLALGAWKRAHVLMPSMAAMGAKRLVPIGLELEDCTARLSSTPPRLTAPSADSHKYRRGLLAIVAGAMPGAPLLAAEAALRAGAGYVKLLSDDSCPGAPADLVVTRSVNEALDEARNSALLFGPGAGRDEGARDRLARVLAARKPTVLDADALHLLDPDLLEGADVTTICLTPHEGELATLCEAFGVTAQGKLEMARGLHDVTGLTVLAKGPDSMLVGGGTVRFFPRGSSWLSVAGTGDVLAGIVASRLATHGDPLRACEEGVWLHHVAARLASPAFSAGDLARAVRPAMAAFL
jgi:hydroxyethylthiazole kinase-like uncharacterized protein yjeF